MVKQMIQYLKIVLKPKWYYTKIIIGDVMSLYVLRALWNGAILDGELGF
jgi:hypothetical protein